MTWHSLPLPLPHAVLLVYDYALTFSMEVERFWFSHQISITTALYFANRYVGLIGYFPILYQFLAVIDEDARYSTSTSPPASRLTFICRSEYDWKLWQIS